MNDDERQTKESATAEEESVAANNKEEHWPISANKGWELTWPIWHMLPRAERRTLAQSYGYKTIGEFEEYMSLQKAVGETTAKPYDNGLLYENDGEKKQKSTNSSSGDDKRKAVSNTGGDKEEDDEGDNSEQQVLKEAAMEQEHTAAADKLPTNLLMELGGEILILPEELLHKVFAWLPVDTYATLALVSPHWKAFTRTEAVYKRLCERLYLNQSAKRNLQVSNFSHSYRNMLEQRPRVRAGAGVYVMKYSRVKPIQRDMWTEVPMGAVLEMVYYRYLYFQEDGRVLYALTATPPHEMFPRFLRLALHGPGRHNDKAAVWGRYTVQKTNVTVQAQQPWQHVQLGLTIDLDNRLHGRYGCLTFESHMSSVKGDFSEGSSDRIKYEVPTEPFRFVRDGRL